MPGTHPREYAGDPSQLLLGFWSLQGHQDPIVAEAARGLGVWRRHLGRDDPIRTVAHMAMQRRRMPIGAKPRHHQDEGPRLAQVVPWHLSNSPLDRHIHAEQISGTKMAPRQRQRQTSRASVRQTSRASGFVQIQTLWEGQTKMNRSRGIICY